MRTMPVKSLALLLCAVCVLTALSGCGTKRTVGFPAVFLSIHIQLREKL